MSLSEFSSDFLASCLASALARGGDYADLFLEETEALTLAFDDGRVKTALSGLITGFGLRVLTGKTYVYLYASDPTEGRLRELAATMAEAVASGAKAVHPSSPPALPSRPERDRAHAPSRDPRPVDRGAKVELLRRADAAMRAASPLVVQAQVNYVEKVQKVRIATSEGGFVDDERTRLLVFAASVAARDGVRERGHKGYGKNSGFEMFERRGPEEIGKEAARIALVNLDAGPAPSGSLPVVIDKGFGGVIFHEACGHALEATSVADDASVFSGRLGARIAQDCVSAVDDGTLVGERGSAAFDDEGLPTARNLLIDGGILRSYLVDRVGQAKMGLPANGCSRRESYRFAPTSRMSNTFILPGPHKLADLISSVDKGLYCARMGGGSVHPATSDFNFGVAEAWLIEKGRLTRPVKGAALIGKGSEILMNIDMVADDLGDLGDGAGTCGSSSGGVPNTVGQPAIRVSGLVIGGRKES